MTTLDTDEIEQTTLPEMIRFEEPTPISLPEAFRVGLHLQYLKTAAQEQHEIGTVEGDKILGTLVDCAQLLSSSTLETSVITQLGGYYQKLQNEYDSDISIKEEDAVELEQKATTWQRVLREDLEREQRIPVADTGLLDVEGLLKEPENLFSMPVWNWLDSRSQRDIKEACKTLVVGCYTSSVFVSLRVVEHCLGEWYENEMDEELDREGWGSVLNQLIQEFLEDTDSNDMLEQLGELPPVLSNLYYLKEKRNEVNHPDKSPNAQEARRTLLIIASTITDIYREVVEMHTVSYQDIDLNIRDSDDEEQMFLELIDKLDRGDGTPKEAIQSCARDLGFDLDEANEILQDLLMAGKIYEPYDGSYKRI